MARVLLDEINIEQRILARESDERNHIERSTMAEVDRLQSEVDQAKHEAEVATHIGDTLNKEVFMTISVHRRRLPTVKDKGSSVLRSQFWGAISMYTPFPLGIPL